MEPRGVLEPISGRTVQGWVTAEAGATCNVVILANGEPVGEGPATDPAGEPGAAAFSIALDRRFAREGSVRFEAQVDGRTFAVRHEDFGGGVSDMFAGQVEAVSEGFIRGWAVNLSPIDAPVTINVFLGSLWLGAVVTDKVRGDIRRRFGGTRPAGFAFLIPVPFRGTDPKVFRLFYANTAIELEGSPLVAPEGRIGPSPEAMAALLA